MYTFQHSSVFCSSSQARTTWLRGDNLLSGTYVVVFFVVFLFLFFLTQAKVMREEHPPPIPSRCLFFFFLNNSWIRLSTTGLSHMSRSTRHVNGGGGAVAFQHSAAAAALPADSCRKPEPAFYLHSACSHGEKKEDVRKSTMDHWNAADLVK